MLGNFGSFDNGFIEQFQALQRELENAFGRSADSNDIRSSLRGSYPPVNIASVGDKVAIYLFASGLDNDKIELSIQNNILTIEAERPLEEPATGRFHLRERVSGKFSRVITLPDDIDPEKVEANYKDGVLQISVQRREKVKPKQIKVQ
ncbi:MAG: Hsp20/alpha crystallin family protein [Gammaproteobacteria bacterium]|nr:Hsp20/alpha crystallin family protein [Gammaproteobacteria bacterium]